MDYKHEWPMITQRTENAVLARLRAGEVSYYKRQGVFEEFEDAFKASVGRRHALVVSSGTAGLHTAMVACQFGPGDEVIVPAYTFFATVTPIFQTGAKPVLVDAGLDGNINPECIEAAITGRTKAVIVTHMWGMPCDMYAILRLCRRHNLRLIEDCSHAHGAVYYGRPIGGFGDMSVFSLQGQKLVTGGEGGIVLCDEDELYYRSLLFGQYNKRCLQEIPESSPLRQFATTGMGLKLRAHPWAIAMANEQFRHLPYWHHVMNGNAAYLSELLGDIDGLKLPVPRCGDEPSWYAYTMLVTAQLRVSTQEFCDRLISAGLVDADMPGSTCPLNLLPLFQRPEGLFPQYRGAGVHYRPGDFPVAEFFYERAIKLPIAPLDNPDYQKVLRTYARIIRQTLDACRA